MSSARAVAAAPVRAPERKRPPLEVVQRRRARRSLLTKLGALMIVSLFIAVLGVVVFQTLRAQSQARLDDLNRKIAVEEDRSKNLRLELAEAMGPERIATTARTRLGMIPPTEVAFLQSKPDDETKATWNPQTEPLPPPPTAPPTTVAAPPTTTARAATTPTTVRAQTTPTTAAARPTTPTTAATTPTTKAPTPTTTPQTPTTVKRTR